MSECGCNYSYSATLTPSSFKLFLFQRPERLQCIFTGQDYNCVIFYGINKDYLLSYY
jgi:hypothetical protein